MKKIAVEKAKTRLQAARGALQNVEESTNYKQFEFAWVMFITALNTIHSVLEQGAKVSPQSRQWFGAIKKQRREDPLLQYLHQARNADEHGIAPIAEHDPGGTFIGDPGTAIHINKMVFDGSKITKLELIPVDGKMPAIGMVLPHVRLATVRDERFGTEFSPPISHLGKPLKDGSPLEVAQLGFSYHENLISEAELRSA